MEAVALSTCNRTELYLVAGDPVAAESQARAAAELLRKGNRVCHVRVRVTQDGLLVAEGRGVYNIHRARATSP